MKMMAALRVLVLALIASAAAAQQGRSLKQYGEPDSALASTFSGDARLFVVTSGDDLVVLDLPSGRQAARIGLPMPSTLLRLSKDHRYFIAFRARTFGPEYMTVVRTGVQHGTVEGVVDMAYADPYNLPEGNATLSALPIIVRTLDIGRSIVPSHDSYLAYNEYYNCYMMAEEAEGKFLMFNASMLEPTEAWSPWEWDLQQPDHYATLVWGPNMYLGYISENEVRLLTLQGTVLESFPCEGVHGAVSWSNGDAITGAFGCSDGIRIVYGNNRSTFLPTETRVGSFVHGFGSVYFGVGRDLAALYHFDLAAENPVVTKVVHGGERRAAVTADDSRWIAVIHSNGNLTVHSGVDGTLLGYTRVVLSVDATNAPSMVSYKEQYIYITLAQHGKIMVVHVDYQDGANGPTANPQVMEQISVGGRPLAMLLAD